MLHRPAGGWDREEVVTLARTAIKPAEARRRYHDDDEEADDRQVDKLGPQALQDTQARRATSRVSLAPG